MTQEDKELLLKDLCARLPYGVIVREKSYPDKEIYEDFNLDDYTSDEMSIQEYIFQDAEIIKPYLRPMSSMSEEEKKDLKKEHLKDEKLYAECLTNAANGDSSMRGKVIPHFAADWCNKNHFDYRGLIPMGLALEAPEGMYKTE